MVRLRLHVAVARTRRWRRAAVTGSRRGVRQCGKARHLGQRMANALPSPGPKSLWPILDRQEPATRLRLTFGIDEAGVEKGARWGDTAGSRIASAEGDRKRARDALRRKI